MSTRASTEAIEAARKAMIARLEWPSLHWPPLYGIHHADLGRALAEAALEAALPHLRPEPSEDEQEALIEIVREGHRHAAEPEGYAAAILTAGFTRRPMPSETDVLDAVYREMHHREQPGSAQVFAEAKQIANAVLALFEGGEG